MFQRLHRQQPGAGRSTGKPRMVDQFGFEDALAAYEELIGTYAWKRP
jgi:hypothetical protein